MRRATLLLLVLSACAPSHADLTSVRVRATPVPTAAPVVTARPAPRTAFAFPVHAPLDNPGGGILWVPRAEAGPWPTDGRIELPTVGAGAPIFRVGVNAKGEMVTPRNARDVVWLDQGALPGVTNNIVLAGHKNWSGRSGSFAGLADLQSGDPVVMTMAGERWTFAVAWTRLYDPKQAPIEQLMGRTDNTTLTLVTCGGVFDRTARGHVGRQIARAELVAREPV